MARVIKTIKSGGKKKKKRPGLVFSTGSFIENAILSALGYICYYYYYYLTHPWQQLDFLFLLLTSIELTLYKIDP